MNNTDNILGERIAYVLVRKGISQTELCKNIQMKTSTLSAIITGERKNPRIETIVPIAKGLNVSLDYLLGITNEPTTDIDLQAMSEKYGISSKALANIEGVKMSYELLSYDDYSEHNLSFSEVFNTLLESELFENFIIDLLNYLDYQPKRDDVVSLPSIKSINLKASVPASVLEEFFLKNLSDIIKKIKSQSCIHLKALKNELDELEIEMGKTTSYEQVIELDKSRKAIKSDIESLEELKK